MIADLAFYNENYGGDTKIPASLFPLFERRAENELIYITGGKIMRPAYKSVTPKKSYNE